MNSYRGSQWVGRVGAASLVVVVALAMGCRHRPRSKPRGPTAEVPAPLSEPACVRSDDECMAAAQELRDAGRITAAAAAYELLCQRDVASACYQLGLLRDHDTEVTDHAQAHAAFDRACQLQMVQSCAAVGVMLLNGRGVAKDPARGRRVLEAACAEADSMGCYHLGWALFEGEGGQRDLRGARAALEKACKASYPGACVDLGAMLANGQGGRVDLVRARALYREGCAQGQPIACANLGFALRNGDGGKRDLVEALSRFLEACDGGDAPGCRAAAVMHQEATPPDVLAAAARFGEACDAGLHDACLDLAALLRRGGPTLPSDPARARWLLERACRQGSGAACFQQAVDLRANHPEEKERFRALMRQACALAHNPACKE